jgi:adenylylsulfate kinase
LNKTISKQRAQDLKLICFLIFELQITTILINKKFNGDNSTGIAIWFTGLSGAGKSTLANALYEKINKIKLNCKELDGDILRNGINAGLGYTEDDRMENIRRAAEIAKLFVESNFITICSFITPSEKMRALARNIIGEKNFIEVYVNCSIEECEKRDVKGLYRKARTGNLTNFTGISSSFETPTHSEIIIDTEAFEIEECVTIIYDYLMTKLETV